jgi:hypothetical protein
MPTYSHIILDTYPLSNAAVALAKAGATPTHSEESHQWMLDCEAAGIILLVPAIAYYEGVRDLYQRQAAHKIVRFQKFCFNPKRYIPLTRDHLTEAGQHWGNLRRTGQATADPHALDGDAILAAQVLALGLPSNDYVVVTRNPDHLKRFGLPTQEWENIIP